MTRCLRVRVGPSGYLLPAESVGAIALYRHSDAAGHRRVIDARRLATDDGMVAPKDPVAVEWIGPHGRTAALVLVDEVEGLIDIEGAAVAAMPKPACNLAVLFDGFWYDAARAAFLLRLRATTPASFAELRHLATLLARLSAERRRDHVDG